jgi:hypothetical protein
VGLLLLSGVGFIAPTTSATARAWTVERTNDLIGDAHCGPARRFSILNTIKLGSSAHCRASRSDQVPSGTTELPLARDRMHEPNVWWENINKECTLLSMYSHKASGISNHVLRYSSSLLQRRWRAWRHVTSGIHDFGKFTGLDVLVSRPCIQR